ncbi:uncharacterized protein [Antedon mediterranea]|uniref:uncharacterized protein n=1 Tax=Antedon mediterranea TaxID=105859 RepID=UPI003AF9E25F
MQNAETEISLNKNIMEKFSSLYKLEYYDQTCNYRLVIKKVRQFDAGIYICKQIQKTGRTESDASSDLVTIYIEVYELPDDPKILCNIDEPVLVEGKTVTLNYTAHIGDIPNPRVEIWISSVTGDHVMNIYNLHDVTTVTSKVTRNMNKCRFGVGLSHHLLQDKLTCETPPLTVHYKPQFQFMLNGIEYNIGDHLKIQLNVMSNPLLMLNDVSVTCWRNSKSVISTICSEAVLIPMESQGIYIFSYKQELTDYDNGIMIQFEANNSVGKDTHTIELQCLDMPTPNDKNKNNITIAIVIGSIILAVILCVSVVEVFKFLRI